ncbi:hypothetical protein RTP6_003700 [Batrachochytrium dendrobatidis]
MVGMSAKDDSSGRNAELPGHLGDIMSSRETSTIIDGDYTPLERILLTANGNLQRILSSYFNAKVTVEILRNEVVQDTDNKEIMLFDREVDIHCLGKICCNAKSSITLSSPKYIEMIKSNQVGIGQLFRYVNILPEFELLMVRRDKDYLIRKYSLETKGIQCVITESFPNHLFSDGLNLVNLSSSEHDSKASHFRSINALSPHLI